MAVLLTVYKICISGSHCHARTLHYSQVSVSSCVRAITVQCASHSNFIRSGVLCSKYCIVWSWWCIWSTRSLPLDNVTLHNTLCSSQATQNPFYLHVGSDILRSIEEHAKDRYTLVVCSVILVHRLHK